MIGAGTEAVGPASAGSIDATKAPSVTRAKGAPKFSSLVVNILRSPYYNSVPIILQNLEKATRPRVSKPIHLKFVGHVAFRQQLFDAAISYALGP